MRVLISLLLSVVVVAGCSEPPESADGGNGSEGDQKNVAQNASGDSLDCEQLKPLLEEAASISQAELDPVLQSATAPRLSDFESQPFTVLVIAPPSVDPDETPFVLGETNGDRKKAWFHFLDLGNVNPAAFIRAMERDPKDKGYSVLKRDYVTDCEIEVEGDTAKGTASFAAPKLFAGEVSFVATRSGGKWQVTEFHAADAGIGTVLKDGTWQAYPKERFHPSTIATLQPSDELRTEDDGAIVLNPVESDKSSRFDFSVFVGKDFVRIDGDRDESKDAAELERRLRDAKEHYLDKGATTPRVRVLAHPEVSMESVLQTIKLCQSAGLERIECWFGPKIEVYSPHPAEAELIEEPPMRLDLRADPDGKLASLHFADRQFDRLEELHEAVQHFSAGSGTTGPDALKVVISVDPHLRMDEFARAYEAVAQTKSKDGKLQSLVEPKNIYFRSFSPFVEVEANFIEEADVPLEEGLDVTTQVIEEVGNITDIEIEAESLAEVPLIEGEITGLIGTATSPFASRSQSIRGILVRRYGGSAASDAAVESALRWLAKHQNKDGSWSFSEKDGVRFANPDRIESKIGATGMALLPFLAAGYTHKEAKYRATIQGGLDYLLKNMSKDDEGRLVEPGIARDHMLVQALATTALAEAYGMTQDAKLREPAQLAVDYIVAAQDPKGGGWRFEPRQPGSTIMTGWQITTLKSAHLAFLKVPQSTIIGAGKFLDSVASDEGARYGYRTPEDRPEADTTTAIGLSCRMLLGWERDNPALGKGIKKLAGKESSKEDMLFNLFATQAIMNHTSGQGETWQKWNRSMRDLLLETQEKRGSDAGSWHFLGREGDEGGRLYNTVLAALILETYYIRQPIYQDRAIGEDKFDLE